MPNICGLPGSIACRRRNHRTRRWRGSRHARRGSAWHAGRRLAGLATTIYAFVAGMLLLRLAIGISLTWRLARAAQPMSEPWTADWRVRVSNVIAGPVTFGSTILLPPQSSIGMRKRRAVLAHEGAHAVNRDFYLLLLASFNRAVFWFIYFAWWHLTRLASRQDISDTRALEVPEDRLSYAEILLDLVQRDRQAPVGLEMARACTVRARVERILAATTAPAKLGWGKRIATAAAILPVVAVSAGCITYSTPRRPAGDRPFEPIPPTVRASRIRLVLFIGPRIDLHRFPRRRRLVRAGERTAKAPTSRGR